MKRNTATPKLACEILGLKPKPPIPAAEVTRRHAPRVRRLKRKTDRTEMHMECIKIEKDTQVAQHQHVRERLKSPAAGIPF